jgi:hypothetical protein
MGVRLTSPLTGRSEEVRLIEAAISSSDTSGVIVCGAAGVATTSRRCYRADGCDRMLSGG